MCQEPDGTNNFAHGFPPVGLSLALLVEGQPVVGAIHDPLRGETFAATAGGGATLNDQPIHVSGEFILVSNGHIHDEMLCVIREGSTAPHPERLNCVEREGL